MVVDCLVAVLLGGIAWWDCLLLFFLGGGGWGIEVLVGINYFWLWFLLGLLFGLLDFECREGPSFSC